MTVDRAAGTVTRPRAPWSATVHDLLGWLAEHVPGLAPEPVALDAEVWTVGYVPGEVSGVPFRGPLLHPAALRSAGRLLRRLHEATVSYEPPPGACWLAGSLPKAPGDVIRHGDIGAGNVVWREGQAAALIDWEFAEPGPAVDDVALAAWTLVPLAPPERRVAAGLAPGEPIEERLEALCSGYGDIPVAAALAAFRRLLDREMARRRDLGGRGIEPWARLLSAGHVERMEATAAWFDASPLAASLPPG